MTSTLNEMSAVDQVDQAEEEYDLQEDVLEMIANSRMSDFAGTGDDRAGLAWAQWCRRMAVAAVNGDVDAVARLVSIDPYLGA